MLVTTAPTAPAIVGQMMEALKEMGFLMLQGMKHGELIGIEQKEVFAKCRAMVAQAYGVAELKAANLCRLAINEAVRAITGHDHYAPAELQQIISSAF